MQRPKDPPRKLRSNPEQDGKWAGLQFSVVFQSIVPGPVELEQDEEHNIPAGEANIKEIAFE